MSYGDRVWAHLQKYGSVTSKGIEDITGTVCPHSVIRDIRKKYGYDCLTFEKRKSVKKIVEDGKVIKKPFYYYEWFLKKLEA